MPFFQFVTWTNTMAVSPAQYSINIVDNTCLPEKLKRAVRVCISFIPLYPTLQMDTYCSFSWLQP